MALAQCAMLCEDIAHRSVTQPRPSQSGDTLLEITNIPVLRFAQFPPPLSLAIIDRRATTPCWRRIASVSRNNPRMESASCSSTNVCERKRSTTIGGSRLRLPPPNNLISARCSSRDSASQPVASDMVASGVSSIVSDSRGSGCVFRASLWSGLVCHGVGVRDQPCGRPLRPRSRSTVGRAHLHPMEAGRAFSLTGCKV